MRSPIKWFGGKGRMSAKIVPLLEQIPHTRYVEPFGGGASILLEKRPVDVETYNDLNSAIVDFFRVLCAPDLFAQFHRRVEAAPYSRELYNEALANWETEPDLIKRVALWFVVARQSFGGLFGSGFGTVVTSSSRGMAETSSNWTTSTEALPRVSARLRRVQIENADWRTILDRYDTPETLFYLDPPYVASTRSDGGYKHEMTDADHSDLVTRLLTIEGKAAMSGYASDLYAPLVDAGWTRQDWHTACHTAGRTKASGIQGAGSATEMQSRVETMWVSPGASTQMSLAI